MTTRTVEGTAEGGYIPDADGVDIVPEVMAALSEQALGSPDAVREEIDLMHRLVRNFWQMEPDAVMRAVSGFSARCAELHKDMVRAEGRDRAWKSIRTQQVDKLHDELERQFKIASRALESRRQDLAHLYGS